LLGQLPVKSRQVFSHTIADSKLENASDKPTPGPNFTSNNDKDSEKEH
jgi:hypothetical protein